jgi:predicted transcriptional regulator
MAKTNEKPVRLSLEISPALNATLDELAGRTHATKSEILRKAIALMEVAVDAKASGRKFGVANDGQELATEIVGI